MTAAQRRRAQLLWPSCVALAVIVPAACGDLEDASLCTAYSEFLDVRAEVTEVRAADIETTNIAEAIDLAERYLDAVHRLQQTSDDRYEQPLNDLEFAANDILLTLESMPDDADPTTWRPLIEDDIEAGQDIAQQVQDAIAPSCEPSTSLTPDDSDTSDTTETNDD